MHASSTWILNIEMTWDSNSIPLMRYMSHLGVHTRDYKLVIPWVCKSLNILNHIHTITIVIYFPKKKAMVYSNSKNRRHLSKVGNVIHRNSQLDPNFVW